MSHGTMAHVAAILGAVGTGTLLLVPRRPALVGGFALLAGAEALLVVSLVPRHDLRLLVDSPARVGALCALALVLVGGAAGLVRFPAVVPVAVLVAAPFRVPVHLGDQEAFLLLPLYAVLVSAALALLVRSFQGRPLTGIPRLLGVPAVAFIALSALSLLWSKDLRAGTIELLFFLFPFGALVCVVVRTPLADWLPRALGVALVALASGFAAVGISQLWTEDLYFARDLEVANAYTSYFRTTSIFADSSVYARELVLAIVVVLAARWFEGVAVWSAVALIGFLFAGLYFSYSQTSMVALAVSVFALSVAVAGRLERRVLLVGTLAVALAVGVAVATAAHGHSAQRFTSGRTGLVENTARVFYHHPLVGVGVGGQPRASQEVKGARKKKERNASHTTPLTVAAELGILGIAAYLALLACSAVLLSEVVRRRWALGLTLAACFLALLVHSLFYAGFFENPTVWGILALAAAVVAAPTRGGRWQT